MYLKFSYAFWEEGSLNYQFLMSNPSSLYIMDVKLAERNRDHKSNHNNI